jgi:hypothetical protein
LPSMMVMIPMMVVLQLIWLCLKHDWIICMLIWIEFNHEYWNDIDSLKCQFSSFPHKTNQRDRFTVILFVIFLSSVSTQNYAEPFVEKWCH